MCGVNNNLKSHITGHLEARALADQGRKQRVIKLEMRRYVVPPTPLKENLEVYSSNNSCFNTLKQTPSLTRNLLRHISSSMAPHLLVSQ